MIEAHCNSQEGHKLLDEVEFTLNAMIAKLESIPGSTKI